MKKLIVESKWSRQSRYRQYRSRYLGGKGRFETRGRNHLPIKIKIWQAVHLHGCHETPRGRIEHYWNRANARTHDAKFSFQNGY